MRQGLTYNDVLIIPAYSDIDSRQDIDIRSEYFDELRLPIISAPMDYVTDYAMAKKLYELGAYGVVNRFDNALPETWPEHQFGFSIGVTDISTSLENIIKVRPHSICIDVAHGEHKKVGDLIQELREFTDAYIIAGNVATAEGFIYLESMGADAIRVGIGAGSACSTRENTGIGVPQLTAVLDCATIATSAAVIADGGIESPGDILKALAAGADAVMLGKMLAGHDESPGQVFFSPDGTKIKPYRGQSIFGTNGYRNAPEGVEGTVPYRGPVERTIEQLSNYIRSGFSYVGARNIQEFRERAEFIQVSSATLAENKTRI